MTTDVLLRLESITKSFPGTVALSGVDLDVRKGEIHAVVGENGAGKSTLLNVIAGVYQPDEGKLVFDGQETVLKNPHHAQSLGIGFVHQELSLCPHLTVAENIFIGRLPTTRYGMVNKEKLNAKCREMLRLFTVDVQPRQRVSALNIAQQQVVEILKAMGSQCRLLILDEPTSSLTSTEVAELFRVLKTLRASGTSILYISHRFHEIFELSDRVTVLRDGRKINTVPLSEVDEGQLVRMMVGRQVNTFFPAKSAGGGSDLLKVEHLSGGMFRDISFTLKRNEVLGFCGLIGSGRTELMRAICGIDPVKSGSMVLEGRPVQFKKYKEAIRQGLVYMTEDRKHDGLFLFLNVRKNVSAAITDRLRKRMLINGNQEEELSKKYVKQLGIKVSSTAQNCASLSGGNQQKVLLAKWLAAKPKVLIVDEPTRGIDVNAKSEIYRLLRGLAEQGIGIIVVTSDLIEAIGMCDRVVVMHEGQCTGVAEADGINEENIMTRATVAVPAQS